VAHNAQEDIAYHVTVSPAYDIHGVGTFFEGLWGYAMQENEKDNGEYERGPLPQ
jgi:hypothetical protein